MSGFLDLNAPSIIAEYSRYLDSDILGKIIFKNFFLNVLRFREEEIYLPLGRSPRYDERKLCGDAQVLFRGRWLNVEIKTSHVVIVHPNSSRPLKCWSFSRMLYTSHKKEKSPYDFAFAVGIHSRGLGDPKYWEDLNIPVKSHKNGENCYDPEALPHESSYLSRCGIFLLPHMRIRRNVVAVTIRAIENTSYGEFFSWGHDREQCRRIWVRTLHEIRNRHSNSEYRSFSKAQLRPSFQVA